MKPWLGPTKPLLWTVEEMRTLALASCLSAVNSCQDTAGTGVDDVHACCESSNGLHGDDLR